MTTHWNDTPKDGWGINTGELFNVILVYEDQTSARRGLSLYQRLMSELGVDYDFNLHVWKFAVLGLARLDEISTEQAAAADLVIVCTRDESKPPEQVQSWFERWLEMKGHNDCALVVLGEAASDQPAPGARGGFFHDLARRGVVTVFSPAAVRGDSATRIEQRAWFPRRPRSPGVDGWFHHDRCLSPRA